MLERRLQKLGVGVLSTAGENGDGPMAEFIRGQVALVAQLERAMIRERLSKGKADAPQARQTHRGPIPYGYRRASDGRQLEPAPERAEIVRRIFAACGARRSLAQIAAELDADRITTPRGRTGWSREALRLIVRNPFYLGENHGVKGTHPALVDRRVWNAAQRGLEGRRRSR